MTLVTQISRLFLPRLRRKTAVLVVCAVVSITMYPAFGAWAQEHNQAPQSAKESTLPDTGLSGLADLLADVPPAPEGNQNPPKTDSAPADLTFSAMTGEDIAKAVDVPLAVPVDDAKVKESRRREAFDAALQGLLPLKPEEIRELLERYDQTQESAALPVYPNPKPEVAVETVSLDPGAAPAVVKVAYGTVTTLNILDSTGSPWPIQDISWAGNFEVVQTGEQGSHIVRITPQSEFATGNMSIRLLTLQTPVILSMQTDREHVHYRFDAIIPQYGPGAKVPLIENAISIQAGDVGISGILQGRLPEKTQRLNVTGTDGRTSAFALNDQTYLRTPLTLLSPAWTASATSADGMRVYQIPPTPVVLLSDEGRMIRAQISKRENIQ
jgi:intracellular multiplication protein IcmK